MRRLEGKTVLVTGAAGGLGRSHCVRLADEGAQVIAVDICKQIDSVPYSLSTPEELKALVDDVESRGGKIIGREADVRNQESIEVAIRDGIAVFGPLHGVVANAGIAPMVHGESRAWDDVIDVNLTGVFNTIQASLPAFKESGQGGSIVIVSSTAGLTGIGGASAGGLGYSASKHGTVGLMRTYANNLAEDWIRVNSVHPTGVATRMTTDASIAEFVSKDPILSREQPNALPVAVIEPIDVSNAILWLLSDEARYVTGVTLPVDAGFVNRR
jgi:SDR family mycofactocin-dependent oxidoreductase